MVCLFLLPVIAKIPTVLDSHWLLKSFLKSDWSLTNNRIVMSVMGNERSGVGSKVLGWWVGSIQDPWYAGARAGWPLKARRSLFPDWPRLSDESSQHRRALHILVQFLAGKFKMEFLPTISLTKAFPVAQICPNLHKIVPSSKANP